MQIVIEITNEILNGIAEKAIREAFEVDGRYPRQGVGVAAVKSAVHRALTEMDYSDMVNAAVERLAPGLVEKVVAAALERKIRDTVRAMAKSGALDGAVTAALGEAGR